MDALELLELTPLHTNAHVPCNSTLAKQASNTSQKLFPEAAGRKLMRAPLLALPRPCVLKTAGKATSLS